MPTSTRHPDALYASRMKPIETIGNKMSYSEKHYVIKEGVLSALYSTGSLVSLGMNFKLHGLSFKLFYCLLSWMNVGYLIG
ncbi:TPA: hypothetical protein KKX77_002637 [Legionella pneumophila]|nr:hypothetical protein [Legionella pneumophila]HCU5995166.1 hypothetical protein [Legionella pneumophila]